MPDARERRRRGVGWRSKDVLRIAALVIAMYLVARLIWFANPLFLTAFLGVLFGLAVATGVDYLQRFHVPRGVGAPLIVAICIGVLVGFFAWIAPTLRRQGAELRERLPESIDRVEAWLNAHQRSVMGTLLGGAATQARVDSASAKGGPPGAAPGRPAAPAPGAPSPAPDSGTTAQGTISLHQRINQQLSGATRYLFPFLSSTLAVIGGVLLILFLTIYIGADSELYHRGLMHLFPHTARRRAGEVLSAIAVTLRRWLVTQLIAMIAIGVVTTVVLLSLRVQAPFALGLLAGLFEFIPTVGPILSAVPAVAMGFLDSPEKALYVAIAYWGIQFVENHLLIPLLMKGGVDLPPVLTILSQALMAMLFGFLGLMTAVPLLAAIMVAVKMLYVEPIVGDRVSVIGEPPSDLGARPPA